MVGPKDLKKYRQIIEEALVALGRDDVGVGEVTPSGETALSMTFSRGTHTCTAEVQIDRLQDRGQAHTAVNAAILPLSKDVAHDSMEKAQAREGR